MNSTSQQNNPIKVGIAGLGAIGGAVAKALREDLEGHTLTAVSDPAIQTEEPNVSFEELCQTCDLIIECLPAVHVPALCDAAFKAQKDVIMISSCALLIYPEILETQKLSTSRIMVPSGALLGLDGVKAMKNIGIKRAKIASTKPPKGFSTAPYVQEMGIELDTLTQKTRIFEGNALEAAKGFPANVNVAATLSLAGIGAEETKVEIWADPAATGNSHEIWVESEYSQLNAKINNLPDPANPKSSVLAAQSIIAYLKQLDQNVIIL